MALRWKMLVMAVGFVALATSSFMATPTAGERILWHASVKKGMKIGWGLVELEAYIDGAFTIGGEDLAPGDILQLELIDEVPTSIAEITQGTPLGSLEVRLNDEELDQFQMQALLEFFPLGFAILPLGYESNDGTTLDAMTILAMLMATDAAVIQGSYIVVQVQTPQGGVQAKYHKDSGISSSFAADLPIRGAYKWVYTSDASNVDITGNPIDKNDSGTPGFDFIPVLMGLGSLAIGAIVVARRRAR
ncbi:MAG: hypothetical protein ACXADX_02470 [Candidatus Hodarchaeales archaeon]